MNRETRKSLITAYKERKAAAGLYAVECLATGAQWAGQAADLSSIWNRHDFTLRQGLHRHAGLQAAWRVHGPDAFRFTILETIDEDTPAFAVDRLLAERLAHWCAKLKAARL